MDFSDHFKAISALFPGASRKVRRELAVRRVKVGTIAFAAAYEQQNEWEQKANEMHIMEYMHDVERRTLSGSAPCDPASSQ